jgi:hypothetical protein
LARQFLRPDNPHRLIGHGAQPTTLAY